MKKVVFIGNMAAPYMVKLCYAMQEFYETEFWFYEHIKKTRPAWWKIPLGDKCKILNPLITYRDKYYCSELNENLTQFDPDVVLLGFFAIPSNYLAYRWAKKNKKKVILVSEYWRSASGKTRSNIVLTFIIRRLYGGLDGILAMGGHAAAYFTQDIGFPDNKVFSLTYPMDIGACFNHQQRESKIAYTYLFSHRLDVNYNPLLALEIFQEVCKKYPGSKLVMNASGPLRSKCDEFIRTNDLVASVEFLDEISDWNSLHLVYRDCDISLSPAIYSNGNISIVEAMASGMGIIMSNRIRFNDKLLEESQGGYICEPVKSTFMECIEKYINTPGLITEHGMRNREVAKRMSTDNVAKSWTAAINIAIVS